MTTECEVEKYTEQNKKIFIDDFYAQLELILDKDEYGIFNTKMKQKYERQLQVSESKIQALVDLKLRSTSAIKKMVENKKNLKNQNMKLKESIITQLKLEVI
jgi:Zn-dependent metalloprotease